MSLGSVILMSVATFYQDGTLMSAPAIPSGPSTQLPDSCNAVPCARQGQILEFSIFDQWNPAKRIRYGYGMTGKHDIAYKWYLKSAKKGDRRAMHNTGYMQVYGMGTPVDRASGMAWLNKAAEAGLTEALLALADIYRIQVSHPDGAAQAHAYYKRAAKLGDARAMNALGNLHALGIGTYQSNLEAYFWYSLADSKGHLNAPIARNTLQSHIDESDSAIIAWRVRAWLNRKP